MRLPLASYRKLVVEAATYLQRAEATSDPLDVTNNLKFAAAKHRQAAQMLDAINQSEKQLRTDGFSLVLETGPEHNPTTQEPLLIGDYRVKERDT